MPFFNLGLMLQGLGVALLLIELVVPHTGRGVRLEYQVDPENCSGFQGFVETARMKVAQVLRVTLTGLASYFIIAGVVLMWASSQ